MLELKGMDKRNEAIRLTGQNTTMAAREHVTSLNWDRARCLQGKRRQGKGGVQ